MGYSVVVKSSLGVEDVDTYLDAQELQDSLEKLLLRMISDISKLFNNHSSDSETSFVDTNPGERKGTFISLEVKIKSQSFDSKDTATSVRDKVIDIHEEYDDKIFSEIEDFDGLGGGSTAIRVVED